MGTDIKICFKSVKHDTAIKDQDCKAVYLNHVTSDWPVSATHYIDCGDLGIRFHRWDLYSPILEQLYNNPDVISVWCGPDTNDEYPLVSKQLFEQMNLLYISQKRHLDEENKARKRIIRNMLEVERLRRVVLDVGKGNSIWKAVTYEEQKDADEKYRQANKIIFEPFFKNQDLYKSVGKIRDLNTRET